MVFKERGPVQALFLRPTFTQPRFAWQTGQTRDSCFIKRPIQQSGKQKKSSRMKISIPSDEIFFSTMGKYVALHLGHL